MAALVQTLPAQTTTVTMLGRPSSSGGYSSPGSQGPIKNHHPGRSFNMSSTGYRGMPVTGPVAPYAFTSTPLLANNTNSRHFTLNTGRSISSPKVSPHGASPSSQPSSPTGLPHVDAGNRPLTLDLPNIPSTGPLMGPSQVASAPKPSPDRYRRNVRRNDGDSHPNRVAGSSTFPSGSGMAAVGALYNHPSQSSSTPSFGSQQSYRSSTHGSNVVPKPSSADDLQLGRGHTTELAARYRRRSVGSIETAGLNHSSDSQETASPHPKAFLSSQPSHGPMMQPQRPASHKHTGSSESVASSRSARSSRPASVSKSPLYVCPLTKSSPRPELSNLRSNP